MRTPVAVDFETEAIEPRPAYPPRPAGVALRHPDGSSRYLAWGHPCENTCTEAQAKKELRSLWRRGHLVFWHAEFDLEVAQVHLGLDLPDMARVHCALKLAFLHTPDAVGLSLKPYARDHLGIKPTEQAQLRDWVVEHVPEARRAPTKWGAYIARAPGRLVGRYAEGDVYRTARLFDYLYPKVMAAGMAEAYSREMALIPELLHLGQQGVPVNARGLARAISQWEGRLRYVDAWVRERLGAPDLDLDKRQEFADALEHAEVLDEWIMTEPTKIYPEGQRSTSFDALKEVLKDRELLQVLHYRARLGNALKTFARPWARMSEESGRIYCQWSATKRADEWRGKRTRGARTGRLQSAPNLQNIPKQPDRDDFELLDARRFPLPNMRSFVVPWDEDEVLLRLDYNQQELRILAHYEDRDLCRAYQENPHLDQHKHAQQLINRLLNANYARKPIKNTGFGIIYGMGLGLLAEKTGTDVQTARRLRKAYRDIFPGLKALERDLKERGKAGEPIRTWGGRVYYCEPPAIVKGQERTFEYKLINTLIQGSAADCTKEAILRYKEIAKHGRLLLTVHDEFLVTVPRRAAQEELGRLIEACESVEFSVPMIADGAICRRSWAEAK